VTVCDQACGYGGLVNCRRGRRRGSSLDLRSAKYCALGSKFEIRQLEVGQRECRDQAEPTRDDLRNQSRDNVGPNRLGASEVALKTVLSGQSLARIAIHAMGASIYQSNSAILSC
jgi:hypothetical protein